MHPFGGTPVCARCSKAVYAAEQVLGPGRRIYHKPCLSCTSCRTRLDSFKLVEHDLEPYCKACHVKNFGTVDLRHANLPAASSSPPREFNDLQVRSSSPDIEEGAQPEVSAAITPDEDAESAPFNVDDFVPSVRARVPDRRTPPVAINQVNRAVSDSFASGSSPTMTAALPLSPASTGSSYSPSKWRPSGMGLDRVVCPACQKTVYFAEQTKAVGKTWHKACLRCTECKTTLNSSRLTEKDGVPICRNCYSKLHGPQGSGYALAGRRAG